MDKIKIQMARKGRIMSILLTCLKADLKDAMKNEMQCRRVGDSPSEETIAKKEVPRAIISMFPEIGKKPADATDEDVIKLLKKYIAQEKERAIYQFSYLKEKDIDGKSPQEVKKLVNETTIACGSELSTPRIKIAEGYLPSSASKEEIISWINENIDFSQYKNKMQAMGPIMKRFKSNDGNFVKEIFMGI
jgi:hypothetical protein